MDGWQNIKWASEALLWDILNGVTMVYSFMSRVKRSGKLQGSKFLSVWKQLSCNLVLYICHDKN